MTEETIAFEEFPKTPGDIFDEGSFLSQNFFAHTAEVDLFRKIRPVNMYQQGKYAQMSSSQKFDLLEIYSQILNLSTS